MREKADMPQWLAEADSRLSVSRSEIVSENDEAGDTVTPLENAEEPEWLSEAWDDVSGSSNDDASLPVSQPTLVCVQQADGSLALMAVPADVAAAATLASSSPALDTEQEPEEAPPTAGALYRLPTCRRARRRWVAAHARRSCATTAC